MKILQCNQQNIKAAVKVLKSGGCVVFPTDTTYGLAVDALNLQAVKRVYRIKGRNFNKPIHVVVGSLSQAKQLVSVNYQAKKLCKKFLPGALTIVLPIKYQSFSSTDKLGKKMLALRLLSAGLGSLGIRMPKNKIALDLVRKLNSPITATSANISGRPACYSAEEVIVQFKNRKYRPDIILDAGRLLKVKPSTVVACNGQSVKILRVGPVSSKQILKICAEKR
jgi:L-threonylcarbamoyladenylate synthase